MVYLKKILKKEKIVIVGNGVAGNSAADTIKSINPFAEVTIVSDNKNYFYSACALPNYLAGEIKRKDIFIKNKYHYKKAKINLILNEEIKRINHKIKKIYTANDLVFSYDKLIIASGSYPSIPNFAYTNLSGIRTFKYIQDADKLISKKSKKIVVIGGGAVGIELSISLIKKGNIVYLVELAPKLLGQAFDINFSNYIKKILQNLGIKVFTSTKLISIEGEENVKKIITDQIDISCDLVICAIGMKPEVKFAKKSGIEIGKFSGIKVNNRMLTNIKDVYACGDCAETENGNIGNMLWLPAKLQGKIAAFNCCGIKKKYQNEVNVFTLNTGEDYFISIGKITNAREENILEKKEGKQWWKILFSEDDKAFGAQIVNNIKIAGLLYICINKALDKHYCQFLLNNPFMESLMFLSRDLMNKIDK